jgi:hypothetical protein
MVGTIISIKHNGDPCGKGFYGFQSDDEGQTWHYRGDLGARTRQWWRNYANKYRATLRYE